MQLVNKVKMKRVIVFMRYHESFSILKERNALRSSVRISHGSENFDFCCCFNGNQFRGFDGGSVKIKGAKTLHLSVVPSKHSVSYIG